MERPKTLRNQFNLQRGQILALRNAFPYKPIQLCQVVPEESQHLSPTLYGAMTGHKNVELQF
jgi:hypothetical protein